MGEVSFWSFGAIYAIGIGWVIYYATLDWRWYLAACASPSWLAVILTFWIPESPRWLLNNGDYDEVQSQLHRIAKWNKRDMSILKGQLIHSQAVDGEKNGSVRALFNKQHFQTSIQMLLTTFCATCAYFGVALFQ